MPQIYSFQIPKNELLNNSPLLIGFKKLFVSPQVHVRTQKLNKHSLTFGNLNT